MNGKGWYNERPEHALAARGIKVRKYPKARNIILKTYPGAKYPDAKVEVMDGEEYVDTAVAMNPSRPDDARVSNGFYDPVSDKIYIKDQPTDTADLRLLLHEFLHDAGGVEDNEMLNEGLTDYFARDLLMRKYLMDKKGANNVLDYKRLVEDLDGLVVLIGEEPLREAYFKSHDESPLKQALHNIKRDDITNVFSTPTRQLEAVIQHYECHPHTTNPKHQKLRYEVLAEVQSSYFSGSEDLDNYSLSKTLQNKLKKNLKSQVAELKAKGPKQFFMDHPIVVGSTGIGQFARMALANPASVLEIGVLFGSFGFGFIGGELLGTFGKESFKHYKKKKAHGQTLFSESGMYQIAVTKDAFPYRNGRVRKTSTHILGGTEHPIGYEKEQAEKIAKQLRHHIPGLAKIEVKTI